MSLESLDQFDRHECIMIDFGLARRYISEDGSLRKARLSTGFRGTSRYASINSHLGNELGRRDDLWSFFYCLVEFVSGALPWRKEKEKNKVGEMKREIGVKITDGLAIPFLVFYKYLEKMQFDEIPDYQILFQLMDDLFAFSGEYPSIPYCWENRADPYLNTFRLSMKMPKEESGISGYLKLRNKETITEQERKDDEHNLKAHFKKLCLFGQPPEERKAMK